MNATVTPPPQAVYVVPATTGYDWPAALVCVAILAVIVILVVGRRK